MQRFIGVLNIFLVGVIAFLLSFYFTMKHYKENLPKEIFNSEYSRIEKLSGGANKLVHFSNGNKNNNGTLISTDALFSMMSYDLSEKPVALYLPLPSSPWTVTLYDENCNPFYSLDERNYGKQDLQVILYKEGQQSPDNAEVVKVKSRGAKGIIVTRLIISGNENRQTLADLRKEMKTGVIK